MQNPVSQSSTEPRDDQGMFAGLARLSSVRYLCRLHTQLPHAQWLMGCLIGLGFILNPSATKAEPLTITSGFIYLAVPFNNGLRFDFVAGGVHFAGWAGEEDTLIRGWRSPTELQTGIAADLSSEASFTNGVIESPMGIWPGQAVGSFAFTAVPVMLTCSSEGDFTTCNAFGSFIMAGTLKAYDFTSGELLFSRDLVGTGRATGGYESDLSPPLYLSYEFGSTPVPEPSALLLLGGGLIGSYWKRRRHHRT